MDLKVSEILTTQLDGIKSTKEKKIQDDFKFTLTKLDQEGLSERLGGLIDEIRGVGKSLNKHMDISDMRKYRGLIKEFVNEVVTNSHEFSRENFLDRRGRHRVYGIVKLIDKNLDELAQELLSQEKNNLTILEKTGEIQGLLLDLIV